jgi:hypothetical protein
VRKWKSFPTQRKKRIMKLSDLPHFQQFSRVKDAKVLRHKETKWDLWTFRSEGKFAHYQSRQSWDVYGRARYSLSFIAERHRFAKFVGVWEVLSKYKKKNGSCVYKTKELSGFDDLKGRLIVNWGEGTRSWAQWLHSQGDKEIVELLPPNYVMDFPGFYNFTLSYAQLQEMVAYPDSNREWQRMLSSVSGVYVILDQQSGLQYVGSAYGINGVWGRWRGYAKNASGGNILLKKLLSKHPSRKKKFQFSILRVLEPGAHKEDVIGQEQLTKTKLGSRAFGLNSN